MTQWGVDTLFNPAKRHMDEEKRRLQSTRQEVGDNSGGRRIDLASGKVTISRSPATNAATEAGADAGDEVAEVAEAHEVLADGLQASREDGQEDIREDEAADEPSAR